MDVRTEMDLSGSGWKLWQDKDAQWEHDELFAPPVDLSKVPTNAPTGGWSTLDTANAAAVSVPGTVEEYLQKTPGPEGDLKGVSWWFRTVRIPTADSPKRLLLRFDAVRLRAEVYVNQKLVGYDVVGNSPFEVDITDAAKPGEEIQLAVRMTDPGGNYDWRDSSPFNWGTYKIPMSHAFGGITGGVKLVMCEPVYISDFHVRNTPLVTTANAYVTIRNTTDKQADRLLTVGALPVGKSELAFFHTQTVSVLPGEETFKVEMAVPNAALWDLDHPNLYGCAASLGTTNAEVDSVETHFGFRWFAPEDVGKNAVFRLNGKRIVLRTAISWGFWPINGIFPTPALAEKQIRTAKELGLNMLNFHRAIGQTGVLDKADELGLLYFEEPGGYVSGDESEFSQKLSREKLLRMVRRDRSHPSLVIYNMINEAWDSHGAGKDKVVMDHHIADLRDAHALDPSRTIVHTSAWAKKPDADDPAKMHMRPFDDTLHMNGWFDFHRAGGPEVWKQDLYKNPNDFYARSTNEREIVYDGEEGAISTPPRLEKIKADLEKAPRLGWDGQMYLDWFKTFDDFLTRKNLRAAFPSVDALTTAMGDVSLYHQGRKIENVRICNANDGYAVNGWEAEIVENHSGIVDCFRNPKGDPTLMAYYNQPLYIAVKTRSQIAQVPGEVLVDFYAINETGLKGAHTLKLMAKDSASQEIWSKEIPVSLTGGEVYGQSLAEGVKIPLTGAPGMFRIEASMADSSGKECARGHDEVFAVNWRIVKLQGKGAVWETGNRVRNFLRMQKNLDAPAYADNLGHLDWIIVSRPPNEGEATDIPPECFRDSKGENAGVITTFFNGRNFKDELYRRTDKTVDLSVPDGATPDPAVPLTEGYSVRWEGQIVPPASGVYTFITQTTGAVRLMVNGQEVINSTVEKASQTNRGQIRLDAEKAAPFVVEFRQVKGASRCKLSWAVPEVSPANPERLIARVRDEGTTLLLLDRADTWMDLIQKNSAVKYSGNFKIGTAWLGGDHFVKKHPLFKDLPVDRALDWPYQAVVRNGRERSGLLLEGEELVAGAWHCFPMQLGTAVGIIPCGKGRIVVSTLEICGNVASSDEPANVARKLLCNFIEYAEEKSAQPAQPHQ
jgi:beta-galactosidase